MKKCIQCQHEFKSSEAKITEAGLDDTDNKTTRKVSVCPGCDTYLSGKEKEYFEEYYSVDEEYKNNIFR